MSSRRFNFVDEEPDPAPKHYWVIRMIITGVLVGGAASAHVLLGFRFF